MLQKSIDSIIAAYPWPPLGHEIALRQLLDFISTDPALQDQRWVAYILGTIRYETWYTFAPVKEKGNGAGHPYGNPDPITGKVYAGAGYIQLTWKGNYERFGKILGIDLVYHPELALQPDIAYKIASEGMRGGLFTGKKLSDYINNQSTDYINSRRIINGLDQAETIASFAEKFQTIL